MIDSLAPLACPIDGLPLKACEANWQCDANHHFDLARQGYLNLLPASQKTSKDPGDSKTMVEARRSVMAAGHFEPFASELAAQLASRIVPVPNRSAVVLDAGCGEGYYTDFMRRSFAVGHLQTAPTLAPIFMGVDISKWCILAAARQYKDVTWVVANNKRLPVLPGSLDIITSLFGFETWQPWARLQTPGQQVLVAHAGPLHLIEMRQLIYESVTIHEAADDSGAIDAGYEFVEKSGITYGTRLESVDTAQKILSMTPHGYRIAPERKVDLEAGFARLLNKPLTIDVMLRWYRRS